MGKKTGLQFESFAALSRSAPVVVAPLMQPRVSLLLFALVFLVGTSVSGTVVWPVRPMFVFRLKQYFTLSASTQNDTHHLAVGSTCELIVTTECSSSLPVTPVSEAQLLSVYSELFAQAASSFEAG